MFVNSFPEPKATESGKCLVSKNFGKKNIVVNAKAKEIVYNNLISPLSLKYIFNGTEWYSFHGREVLVENSHFLLINDRQKYSTYINSDVEAESFCIFFRKNLIEELYTYNISTLNRLLDDPYQLEVFHLEIIEKRFLMDPTLLKMLEYLRSNEILDNIEEDYLIYNIINNILKHQISSKATILNLPFTKVSTKLELYKRIYMAKDYIDAHTSEIIDLDRLADISHLSKYHLLRVFKTVLGISPHKYIVIKKLDKAKELLIKGYSVSDTCSYVGFNNTSSFCRLFKEKFNITPLSYQLS